MKAIRYEQLGGPEVLQVVDMAVPVPGPGQVLIRVEAAGVNFADTRQRMGAYLTPTELPATPGMEVAGVIEEMGPRVAGHFEGERVMCLLPKPGGYAEYALAPATSLVSLPEDADAAKALALLVQGLTAYFMLRDTAHLGAGESVLIQAAAGGVGSLAVQLAQLMEAGLIIGTASAPDKLAAIRELGADAAIDYRAEPVFSAQVLELTRNKGVDIVLESVGGDIFSESLKALAKFGRMVVYGNSSGRPVTLAPAQLMPRNQSIMGYWLVNSIARPEMAQEAMEVLLAYYAEGALVIDVQGFALDDAAEAHRQIEARQTRGKVVLCP